MLARVASLVVVALVVAAPAGGDTIVTHKQSVDVRIAVLNQEVARMRSGEHALEGQIAAASLQIRALEQQAGDIARRLVPLERELRLRRERLRRLDALYEAQTARLRFLRRAYRLALDRLNARLVAIYEWGEPDTVSVLLSARSFSDVLDAVDYVRRIGTEDRRIASVVGTAKQEVTAARRQTRAARERLRQETRVVAIRVEQARALRDRLLGGKAQLAAARAAKLQGLAGLTAQERQEVGEMEALRQESAQLAAQIRAAQVRSSAATDTTPSAAGLIWPVEGPVTSPFGVRWGRMHEGIDIGVPTGTPIHAAAAGRVIIAGWITGYGNVVYIDHGHGLSTGYAHQSQLAVAVGQEVAQGQVIGYVGCTGHCFGPHLHFEVRVNGVPVDPLGYL